MIGGMNMAYQLENKMVIGISTRALFDLSEENEIFEKQGVEAYCKYQVDHEGDILKPGPGFSLVQSLLALNQCIEGKDLVEVIVMSRNRPDTSLRVFNSIKHYHLNITRAVLVSGASLATYLTAFHTDLFLSAYEDDVQSAVDSGIAAGIICTEYMPRVISSDLWSNIRIAFDGDAVLFTDESEKIYKEEGLGAFEENEERNADFPLEEGPFANFLRKLSGLQKMLGTENCPIRTALVTSRSAPAHERVIRTLRAWDVRMDEAFFLGGVEKKDVLRAFGAQIFFDDQSIHTLNAALAVPAARVPYRSQRKGETQINENNEKRKAFSYS